MKKYNCKTCLFANELENGDVYCDKRELEGVKCIIKKDKVNITCHCHSNYPLREFRIDRNWDYIRDADDVCEVCHRFLDMQDKSQYKYIEIKNKNNEKQLIRKCKICIKKGR